METYRTSDIPLLVSGQPLTLFTTVSRAPPPPPCREPYDPFTSLATVVWTILLPASSELEVFLPAAAY